MGIERGVKEEREEITWYRICHVEFFGVLLLPQGAFLNS